MIESSPLYALAAVAVAVKVETAQPVGNNASNIWELMKLGVNQADHANITGEGLQSLKDDPSVQAAEGRIGAAIGENTSYGKQAFSIPGNYPTNDPKETGFTADGPSRNFAIGLLTQNPAFLMVHSANLYANNTTVSADGTISTTWKVVDDFDYLPEWNNDSRKGLNYWEYNIGATIADPIYYGLLGAKAQVPTTAEWNQTIPSQSGDEWWNDSCSRCE